MHLSGSVTLIASCGGPAPSAQWSAIHRSLYKSPAHTTLLGSGPSLWNWSEDSLAPWSPPMVGVMRVEALMIITELPLGIFLPLSWRIMHSHSLPLFHFIFSVSLNPSLQYFCLHNPFSILASIEMAVRPVVHTNTTILIWSVSPTVGVPFQTCFLIFCNMHRPRMFRVSSGSLLLNNSFCNSFLSFCILL